MCAVGYRGNSEKVSRHNVVCFSVKIKPDRKIENVISG